MPFTKYWKALVVLNHEIFHAITSLLTGAKFASLILHANESGETITSGVWKYSIPLVYSAGYIGSSLTGGFLLYSGLKKKNARYSCLTFGIFLFLSTITFSQFKSYAFMIGISWSLFFFLGAIAGDAIGSFLLVLFGTAFSLYSIYDMSDFIRSMKNSDAGILAGWIVENFVVMIDVPITEKISRIGYGISICWSMISLFIILYFLKISFFPKLSENEIVIEKFLSSIESGAVNQDVAEWFLKKGVDLDGRPIPPKLVKELQEKGNPNE